MSTTSSTMPFYIIDTLQFSKRMQKAGLQEEIADELAEAIKETQTQSLDDLVIKRDLKDLESKLDIRVDKLETKIERLEAKIDSIEHRLTLKMFLMLSAAVATITWLNKVIN